MTKKIKVPHDHVLMRHDDPHASCTIEGVTYACEHGHVVVPTSAVHHLVAHGFVADGTDADQDAPPAPAEETSEQVAEAAEIEAETEAVAEIVAEIEAPAVAEAKPPRKARTPKTKA